MGYLTDEETETHTVEFYLSKSLQGGGRLRIQTDRVSKLVCSTWLHWGKGQHPS